MENLKVQAFFKQGRGAIATSIEGETENAAIFHYTVHASTDSILTKIVARLDLPAGRDFRIFKEGFQSWSICRSFAGTETDSNRFSPSAAAAMTEQGLDPERLYFHKHGYLAAGSDSVQPAYHWAALRYDDGAVWLAGALTFHRFITKIGCDPAGRQLLIELDCDDIAIPAGAALAGETLYLYRGREPEETVVERYAGLAAERMKAGFDPSIPVGWCSWYEFFTAVRGEDIYRNLAVLRDKAYPVEVVLLDDGYQQAIGDWLAVNDKFGNDLRGLVRDTRAAGFKPGIWLAPFIVSERSALYREHPDWVVRDEQGRNEVVLYGWNQRIYGLDLSRPEVLEYLVRVFTTMARDWGMDYFKLDFVFAGMVKGRRASDRMTAVEGYRNALTLIRRAVGPGKYLLGCGAPTGPSIGLFDGMRIGPDVAPRWSDPDQASPAVANALRNILNRSFYHGKWWMNDPDCLLVRDSRTELTGDEVLSLATAIKLSGGMLFYGDDLAALAPERERIIAKLGKPLPRPAFPVDFLRRDLPELYLAQLPDRIYLGVFNFSDLPVVKEVALSVLGIPVREYRIADYWEERDLGRTADRFDVPLERHASKLLVLTPEGPA
jgi:alpha-galactosidase